MTKLDFWYSIGSTYSYLTVARMRGYARDHGLQVTWRPFDVRRIMMAQNNVPFRDKPIKTAYMWRDMERRAELFGLPINVPAPYPLPDLPLANKVAVLGMTEGWGEDYTIETYRRWFVDGQEAGSDPNLSDSLRAVGQDPVAVLARAAAEDGTALLTAETDKAEALGIFGSPSFVVGEELFWGDDRLDEAAAWAAKAG